MQISHTQLQWYCAVTLKTLWFCERETFVCIAAHYKANQKHLFEWVNRTWKKTKPRRGYLPLKHNYTACKLISVWYWSVLHLWKLNFLKLNTSKQSDLCEEVVVVIKYLHFTVDTVQQCLLKLRKSTIALRTPCYYGHPLLWAKSSPPPGESYRGGFTENDSRYCGLSLLRTPNYVLRCSPCYPNKSFFYVIRWK